MKKFFDWGERNIRMADRGESESDLQSEIDDNPLSVHVNANNIFRKVVRTLEREYREADLVRLKTISEDYDIPLDELVEKYSIKVNHYKRKPRLPGEQCLALRKKDKARCSSARKDGSDYCGIHQKANNIKRWTPTSPRLLERTVPQKSKPKIEMKPKEKSANNSEENELDSDVLDIKPLKYQGKSYLVWEDNVYEKPEDASSVSNLADLNQVGELDDDGKVEFYQIED